MMPIAILGSKSTYNKILVYLKQLYQNNKLLTDHIFFENFDIFTSELQKQYWHIAITLNQPMELIYEIKKVSPKTKIIFISPTDKFALEGYRADISYYLLYPINCSEFQLAINRCLNCCQEYNEYIVVNSNWQKIPIFLKDIIFAEKNGHNIIIHTKNKTISTRMTFKDFIEKTKHFSNFINCVKGALVNLSWVDNLESQNFLMTSGERIPIRRQDRKKIKNIYTQYLIDHQIKN